jgi:hypothetical protein
VQPTLPSFRHVAGFPAARCAAKERRKPGSSRMPFATLAGPAPSGSTWTVPALSGLLPPIPATPGQAWPRASLTCCDRNGGAGFSPRSINKRLVARTTDDASCLPPPQHPLPTTAQPCITPKSRVSPVVVRTLYE